MPSLIARLSTWWSPPAARPTAPAVARPAPPVAAGPDLRTYFSDLGCDLAQVTGHGKVALRPSRAVLPGTGITLETGRRVALRLAPRADDGPPDADPDALRLAVDGMVAFHGPGVLACGVPAAPTAVQHALAVPGAAWLARSIGQGELKDIVVRRRPEAGPGAIEADVGFHVSVGGARTGSWPIYRGRAPLAVQTADVPGLAEISAQMDAILGDMVEAAYSEQSLACARLFDLEASTLTLSWQGGRTTEVDAFALRGSGGKIAMEPIRTTLRLGRGHEGPHDDAGIKLTHLVRVTRAGGPAPMTFRITAKAMHGPGDLVVAAAPPAPPTPDEPVRPRRTGGYFTGLARSLLEQLSAEGELVLARAPTFTPLARLAPGVLPRALADLEIRTEGQHLTVGAAPPSLWERLRRLFRRPPRPAKGIAVTADRGIAIRLGLGRRPGPLAWLWRALNACVTFRLGTIALPEVGGRTRIGGWLWLGWLPLPVRLTLPRGLPLPEMPWVRDLEAQGAALRDSVYQAVPWGELPVLDCRRTEAAVMVPRQGHVEVADGQRLEPVATKIHLGPKRDAHWKARFSHRARVVSGTGAGSLGLRARVAVAQVQDGTPEAGEAEAARRDAGRAGEDEGIWQALWGQG